MAESDMLGGVIEIYAADAIIEFGSKWEQLAASQPQYVPSFGDIIDSLEDRSTRLCLVACRVAETVVALALFAVADVRHRWWLGEREVLRWPVRTATLYGSASLGTADPDMAMAMLDRIAAEPGVDLLTFRDVPRSDYLYEAVSSGRWRGPASVSHHRTTRRLARLPETMDGYWSSLRTTTRKAALRDWRMFDKLQPTYEVFGAPGDIDAFIRRAAGISARTYQSKIGVDFADTPQLRRHFASLAADYRLRGYVASIGDRDVAFAWGDISHGVFYYRKTGFDPELARYSPGKAILFKTIADLIETRAAHTFDFSGRDMDYKERFSTMSVDCADFIASRWSRPRGVVAIGLDHMFRLPKVVVPRVLGPERYRQLQLWLRK